MDFWEDTIRFVGESWESIDPKGPDDDVARLKSNRRKKIMKTPKRFKTNGDITKFLIKISKELGHSISDEEGRLLAIQAMNSFPLSSHKMLYDQDLKEMDPTARKTMLDAAIESDNQKIDRLRRDPIFGQVLPLPFGRSTYKK